MSLSGNAREQRLQGALRGNFGQINAAAAGTLLASLSGDLKIQAEGLQPGLWGLPVTSGSLVSGKFSGNFRLPGTLCRRPGGPGTVGAAAFERPAGPSGLKRLSAWKSPRPR